MILPELHHQSLERHLAVHEERIAFLRSQKEAIEGEMYDDETLIASGRDKSSPEAAGKLAEKADPAGEGARHQEGFTKVRSKESLRTQRELLEREQRVHEMLLAMGRDQKVLNALSELAENLDFARDVSRDPKGSARDRGIEIPDNMILNVEVDEDRVSLRITYYDDLYPFVVTWDNMAGFSDPVPRRQT
jgi:hypothetical protein